MESNSHANPPHFRRNQQVYAADSEGQANHRILGAPIKLYAADSEGSNRRCLFTKQRLHGEYSLAMLNRRLCDCGNQPHHLHLHGDSQGDNTTDRFTVGVNETLTSMFLDTLPVQFARV
jgi:hypothetical protein